MRTSAKWALAVLALVSMAGPAWANAAALAIVNKGITAHGGEGPLTKALICSRTEIGAQAQASKDLTFTSEVVRSLPDRLRLTIEVEKRLTIVRVLNGDKGWERVGGPPVELNKQGLSELREEVYVHWLATLVPLKKPGFALSVLPEGKVGGQAVVGIKVVHRGHADSSLYFFKNSGLLAKIARRATEAGVPVDKEYLYSGHKYFGSVKLPAKEVMTINGRRFTELTITGYKFLPSAEASKFERP